MSLADRAKDRAKKNPTWLLGILLGVHLIVVSLNRSPGQPDLKIVQVLLMALTSPVQSIFGHGIASIKSGLSNYASLRDARQDNQRLITDRAQLEKQVIDLREKVHALEQLNSLREWQETSKYPAVSARIVGRDANELFNTVVIDKGSGSGIVKDQPVVTAEGLVGRVIYTSPISARVLLITDERHGAGAIIGQSAEGRLLGVVKGKKDFFCELKFISPPEKVENGEEVITSGQDGIYPKGLLIGRIRRPDSNSTVVPQTVDLEPAAPLGKLETVLVLAISPDSIRQAINQALIEEKKQERPPDRKRR